MFGDYPTTFLLQRYKAALGTRPTAAAFHRHRPYDDD
jgi:hypothetical protein